MILSEKSSGFTLVEVVTTVVIAGILALITFSMYRKNADRARALEGVGILDNIYSCQNMYFRRIGAYGTSQDQLDCDTPEGRYFNGAGAIDDFGNWTTPIKVHATQGSVSGNLYVLKYIDTGDVYVSYTGDTPADYEKW